MASRRKFLAQGISGALASCVAKAEAESTSSVQPAGPFVVRANDSHTVGPWVLGGHYPVMAKVTSADTHGRFSIVQAVQPPDTGPGMHIHRAQNEWFFVLNGTIGVQLGKQKMVLKTGDSLMAPRGVPHAYVTLGTQDAQLLFLYDPAGDMEAYFATLSRIKGLGEGHADPRELARAFEQHGMTAVGPPLRAADFPTA